jgi:hypothetical protein
MKLEGIPVELKPFIFPIATKLIYSAFIGGFKSNCGITAQGDAEKRLMFSAIRHLPNHSYSPCSQIVLTGYPGIASVKRDL